VEGGEKGKEEGERTKARREEFYDMSMFSRTEGRPESLTELIQARRTEGTVPVLV
jgi:hypothetical protein